VKTCHATEVGDSPTFELVAKNYTKHGAKTLSQWAQILKTSALEEVKHVGAQERLDAQRRNGNGGVNAHLFPFNAAAEEGLADLGADIGQEEGHGCDEAGDDCDENEEDNPDAWHDLDPGDVFFTLRSE
jgi:hypothetical protein